MLKLLCSMFLPLSLWGATTYTNDWLSDFETGSDNAVVTLVVLTNSLHFAPTASGHWFTNQFDFDGTQYSGKIRTDLSGDYSITVNGTNYPGPGSRVFDFDNSVGPQGIGYLFDATYSSLSIGFYSKIPCKTDSTALLDLVMIQSPISGKYVICQFHDNASAPTIKAHGPSTSGNTIDIGSYCNSWIWVTMLYNASGNCQLAAYDPSASLAQIGSTSTFAGGGGDGGILEIGHIDVHATFPATHTRVDTITINTNGVFPLFPGASGSIVLSRSGTGRAMKQIR